MEISPTDPDQEPSLIRRFQDGEEQAFDRLFEMHWGRVYRMAYSVTGDKMAAQDLAQEVFISLHRTLGAWEDRARLSTWLYRVTLNRSLDWKRRPLWAPLFDSLFNRPGKADPLREAQKEQTLDRIRHSVNNLPRAQREVFLLRVVSDISTAETAEILGVKEGTVKALLHQASQNLRSRLGEGHDLL